MTTVAPPPPPVPAAPGLLPVIDARVSIQDIGKDGGDQNSHAAPCGHATRRSDHRPC